MAYGIEWDDEQIVNFISYFQTVPDLALNAAAMSLEETLAFIKGNLPDNPSSPISDKAPSPLRTPKQKRWWWAALKAGEIPGWEWIEGGWPHYQEDAGWSTSGFARRKSTGAGGSNRSLADSFESQVTETPYEAFGTLESNLPFAPWVVGPDFPGKLIDGTVQYQAAIHSFEQRWWQFDDAVGKIENEAEWLINDLFWEKLIEFMDKAPGEKVNG